MKSGTAIGVLIIFLVAGLGAGLMLTVGCSENLQPGSSRKETCDTVAGGVLNWWIAVLWPAALFGVSRLIPSLNRHGIVVSLVVAVLAVAFWTPLFVVVNG